MKRLLTTAPVLSQPDIEKPFDVYCDASGIGIGCVLMKKAESLLMHPGNLSNMKSTIRLMIGVSSCGPFFEDLAALPTW